MACITFDLHNVTFSIASNIKHHTRTQTFKVSKEETYKTMTIQIEEAQSKNMLLAVSSSIRGGLTILHAYLTAEFVRSKPPGRKMVG